MEKSTTNLLELEYIRHMDMVRDGVAALVGNKIDVPLYTEICRSSIGSGHVASGLGEYIITGITDGFDPLVDEDKLPGIVHHKNYPRHLKMQTK